MDIEKRPLIEMKTKMPPQRLQSCLTDPQVIIYWACKSKNLCGFLKFCLADFPGLDFLMCNPYGFFFSLLVFGKIYIHLVYDPSLALMVDILVVLNPTVV